MRLIDVDALAYKILSEYGADGGTEDVNTIYGMVINAPTIDAELVVRCKDCKWHDKGKNESEEWSDCIRPIRKLYSVDDDDYCSYGERREP